MRARVDRRTMKDYQDMAKAANQNEQVTRLRVEAVEEVVRRGFWGRLRWLVLGR